MTVRWRGMSAVYTTDERQIMRQLRVSEQAVVHALKSFTDGEISSSMGGQVADKTVLRRTPQSDGAAPPPVYTNPEDIEFGKPENRPKIIAVVWSWRKHKIFPHKGSKFPWKSADHRIKVWKAWHERQGWKVTSHPSGYFATDPAGARVAISLHEYDRDSHERLN